MTFEEKLDAILDGFAYAYLHDPHPEFSNKGHFFDKLCSILELEVSELEINLLRFKLLADGHIGTLSKAPEFPIYRITPGGLDFIIDGGYSRRALPSETMQPEKQAELVSEKIPGVGSLPAVPDPKSDTHSEHGAYVGIAEAASLLKLSKSTVYGLVHRKQIPHYKQGKKLYFSEEELNAWIKAGRKSTVEEIKQGAQQSLYKRMG